MSLPKFVDFFRPFLEAISDGELHSPKEVRDYISNKMSISDDDLSMMLPSGRITVFYSRVGWARTYLDKAGLVETPSRGKYRITDEGRKALDSGDKIDIKYLEQFDKFKSFHSASPDNGSEADSSSDTKDKTPMEIMADAYKEIKESLSDQLMKEVIKLSPAQFESLVVKLLLAMNYGDGTEDAGQITRMTNDEGIDGIIKEDKLGFSNIYIQAKQWNPDRTVDRPELQKFVGALTGKQAQKGLFITTAKFSSGALKYAENLLNTKVVLVDGSALMTLMINHNLGVSVDYTYAIKKLDMDFFEDDI